MSDKTYNGWTNYETWNVALWLDNEEGSQREAQYIARRSGAQGLKGWVEEMMPDLGASMFADLLGAAMSEVNWHEIAEHYTDEDDTDEDDEARANKVGA